MKEYGPHTIDAKMFAKEFRSRVYYVAGLSSRRNGTPEEHYSRKTGVDLEHVMAVLAGYSPCPEILADMGRRRRVEHTVYYDLIEC